MINYNKLRYFYEVSNTLNLTKASESLYISQPALSRHISDLESEFGAKLFTRTNRNLLLTEVGEALKAECEGLFADEKALEVALRGLSKSKMGFLKIAFMGIEIAFRMQELIVVFKQQYPSIEVQQTRLNWDTVEKALISGEADIGVMLSMSETTHELLVSYSLSKTQLAVILPERHPLAAAESIDMVQLKNEKILMLSKADSHTPYDTTVKLCKKAGFSPKVAGEYPNVETVVMMVQAGAGVAVLSSMAPLSRVKGISCVPIASAPFVSVDIVWNPKHNNSAVAPFLDMARAFNW